MRKLLILPIILLSTSVFGMDGPKVAPLVTCGDDCCSYTGDALIKCRSRYSQGCIDIDPHFLPSVSATALRKNPITYTSTYVCPGDEKYDYYAVAMDKMDSEIGLFVEKTPQEIDNFCEQFTNSFSNEKCKELVERTKETEEYKESLEKYNKEQENIKKQKEIEEKQKELEEKQAEIEKKQRELEEKQSQILESQENIVTTETVEKIVEEKVEKKMTEEISKAKKELGDKAVIFESLVKLFKQKDQKTQNNVKALLKTFAQSKDEYTRNIGIYFGYLVE